MSKAPAGAPADAPGVDWAKTDGLVPCICQDAATGAVLMMAWMDRAALEKTLDSGRLHFFSRSRGRQWMKGEESGNVLELVSLHVDCDGDTLLAVVHAHGPACHTGNATCWFTPVKDGPRPILETLWATIQDRKAAPRTASWTNRLLSDRALLLSKIKEEAEEVDAAARGDIGEDDLPHEAADLLYHLMVLVAATDHEWRTVMERLRARHK